jgi:hypothetical protein
MYQIGCENVRDHDETTISKTAVDLAHTDQTQWHTGTCVATILSISMFPSLYDNVEGIQSTPSSRDGNGDKLQRIPLPFGR